MGQKAKKAAKEVKGADAKPMNDEQKMQEFWKAIGATERQYGLKLSHRIEVDPVLVGFIPRIEGYIKGGIIIEKAPLKNIGG